MRPCFGRVRDRVVGDRETERRIVPGRAEDGGEDRAAAAAAAPTSATGSRSERWLRFGAVQATCSASTGPMKTMFRIE